MAEKVYQISSDQFGVIKFDKPWLLIHIEIDGSKESFQFFFPTVEFLIKNFPMKFEDKIIREWNELGIYGEEKIDRLKRYLLETWEESIIENLRVEMCENYGYSEFENQTSTNLINNSLKFISLVIVHILLNYDKKNFIFEDLCVTIKCVDSFLAVNFWDKSNDE